MKNQTIWPQCITNSIKTLKQWVKEEQVLKEVLQHKIVRCTKTPYGAVPGRLYPPWPSISSFFHIDALKGHFLRHHARKLRWPPDNCALYKWNLMLSSTLKQVEEDLCPFCTACCVPKDKSTIGRTRGPHGDGCSHVSSWMTEPMHSSPTKVSGWGGLKGKRVAHSHNVRAASTCAKSKVDSTYRWAAAWRARWYRCFPFPSPHGTCLNQRVLTPLKGHQPAPSSSLFLRRW